MANNLKIRIFVEPEAFLPAYQNVGDSGTDLHSSSRSDINIPPMQSRLVPTGIFVEIPDERWEIQVRSRSGLAAKYNVFVLNSPGTVDSKYRGEIKAILYNAGENPFTVKYGDRIAQMVLCPIGKMSFEKVEKHSDLEATQRGTSGFGSTGINR